MIHEVNSVFHKIVISKKDIINLVHFADARDLTQVREMRAVFFAECKSLRLLSRNFGKILFNKRDLKGRRHGGADLAASSAENLKFIVEYFLHFLPRRERREAISACIIFNYAVGLLEIVIAFETTRSAALLAGTRQNITEGPEGRKWSR